MSKIDVLKQAGQFFWKRKKWWLWPVGLALFLLAMLVALSAGNALAPFIYTLF